MVCHEDQSYGRPAPYRGPPSKVQQRQRAVSVCPAPVWSSQGSHPPRSPERILFSWLNSYANSRKAPNSGAPRLTRPLRSRIRSLSVVRMYIRGELEVDGNASLLRETAAAFASLDARRRAGDVDPVRYEAEWARIYETLPSSNVSVMS
ncbi:DUF6611 family protein [Diaminobutyricibacter tongyongensis]